MFFRKFHRQLALIVTLPLLLTIITGIAFPIVEDWLGNKKLAEAIIDLHSGKTFGLESIYPVINGLGLAVMLGTGLTMIRRPKSRLG
jgi:uncharacterized iron-regulated membrane protein